MPPHRAATKDVPYHGDRPTFDYGSHAGLGRFKVDIREGASVLFDIDQRLFDPPTWKLIDRAVELSWPILIRSEARALFEEPEPFVKAVPVISELRVQQVLSFLDALATYNHRLRPQFRK